ncbi:hypothetical protein J6590_004509 [Homalodisca vitripennis]|nr:hypothetical protein J6590_004509 [Homalodisca vitripennis]
MSAIYQATQTALLSLYCLCVRLSRLLCSVRAQEIFLSVGLTGSKKQETFNHSNTPIDHMTATSSNTRHPHRPPSSKPLTHGPKRARSSIHLILSGRAFQRWQA